MRNLFLHGLGQTASAWDGVVSNFPQGSCVCLPLSQLLTGESPTYDKLYKSVERACGNDPQPLRLCGLSLGAVLALEYAIRHPDSVSSMVLIAPQFKMPKTLLRLQNVLFRILPNAAFAGTGFRKSDFLALTRSMLHLDFTREAKKLSCPTLILYGERDRANRSACKKLADLIPGARLKCIPQAGHEINVDAPNVLSAEILSFFSV